MLARLRSLMTALVHRRRLERDLRDELSFHVQARADDLTRKGQTPEEALRRARIEFGGVERFKEDCRQAKGLRLIDELTADLRYGAISINSWTAFAKINPASSICSRNSETIRPLLSAIRFRQFAQNTQVRHRQTPRELDIAECLSSRSLRLMVL